MASAQEPSIIRFYHIDTLGNRTPLLTQDVSILGPGGSADGVKASTANADNQLFVPVHSKTFKVNDTLLLTSETIGTDGIDVSDCFVMLPIKKSNGQIDMLTFNDFANPTPIDYTATAGIEQTWGGHLAQEQFNFGGSFIFFSLEDDT